MHPNTNKIMIENTDDLKQPSAGNDLYQSRTNIYGLTQKKDDPLVTIAIVAYNRIEKTKKCIEYVLKYTNEIDYELFLFDNGSDDGTFEFFKSVKNDKKTIIRITKNIGTAYPPLKYKNMFRGKYIVTIANDICVTKNWLSNMLKCFESDKKVGFVVPMSSIISNLQAPVPQIEFETLEEMQEMAEKFNQSDPNKWEERMRLIVPLGLIKREILDLVGYIDFGFFHDFAEDDYCRRIMRAGYKLILCGDTFVHHNHPEHERKVSSTHNLSLKIGRQNFKEKYYGLDALNDVTAYEQYLFRLMEDDEVFGGRVLGIDVGIGTAALVLKNKLKGKGIYNCEMYAYTTHAKHYLDLQTVFGENVICDRIDYLYIDHFFNNKFEFVICGKELNAYTDASLVIQDIVRITVGGGRIFLKLRDMVDRSEILQAFGIHECEQFIEKTEIDVESLYEYLRSFNFKKVKLGIEYFDNLDPNIVKEYIDNLQSKGIDINDAKAKKLVPLKNYIFYIEK